MIDSIHIEGIASYRNVPQHLTDLSKINFFYGSNGTGKTTVSRVIADQDRYVSCRVAWKHGARLQTMVYNRDFLRNNFYQSPALKGVFTLGQKNVDISQKISEAKAAADELNNKIANLTITL